MVALSREADAGWHEASGCITGWEERMRYDVVVRYFVNAGSQGDRITPDEFPFIEQEVVSQVVGRALLCRGEWRDVALVGDQRQLAGMLNTHHRKQIEAIARRALEDGEQE